MKQDENNKLVKNQLKKLEVAKIRKIINSYVDFGSSHLGRIRVDGGCRNIYLCWMWGRGGVLLTWQYKDSVENHKGNFAPHSMDMIASVFSDASVYDENPDIDDFYRAIGEGWAEDTDTIFAECKNFSEKFKFFFGDDYNKLQNMIFSLYS